MTTTVLPLGSTHCASHESRWFVRICGDYWTTVNKAMKVNSHPIPRMEDLFTAMSGGLLFNLLHAYLQLQVDELSIDYLVINMHRGLFE